MNPLLRWPLVLLSLFAIAGCGPRLPTATETQKKEAREALVAALDAWQAGKLNELKSRTPPISFTDDDVVQGNSLISYELDPALEIKPHTDVAVNLIVKTRAGESQHRTATYQVSFSPAPSVIRNDP